MARLLVFGCLLVALVAAAPAINEDERLSPPELAPERSADEAPAPTEPKKNANLKTTTTNQGPPQKLRDDDEPSKPQKPATAGAKKINTHLGPAHTATQHGPAQETPAGGKSQQPATWRPWPTKKPTTQRAPAQEDPAAQESEGTMRPTTTSGTAPTSGDEVPAAKQEEPKQSPSEPSEDPRAAGPAKQKPEDPSSAVTDKPKSSSQYPNTRPVPSKPKLCPTTTTTRKPRPHPAPTTHRPTTTHRTTTPKPTTTQKSTTTPEPTTQEPTTQEPTTLFFSRTRKPPRKVTQKPDDEPKDSPQETKDSDDAADDPALPVVDLTEGAVVLPNKGLRNPLERARRSFMNSVSNLFGGDAATQN